jgi:GGDEF domain-containing protein
MMSDLETDYSSRSPSSENSAPIGAEPSPEPEFMAEAPVAAAAPPVDASASESETVAAVIDAGTLGFAASDIALDESVVAPEVSFDGGWSSDVGLGVAHAAHLSREKGKDIEATLAMKAVYDMVQDGAVMSQPVYENYVALMPGIISRAESDIAEGHARKTAFLNYLGTSLDVLEQQEMMASGEPSLFDEDGAIVWATYGTASDDPSQPAAVLMEKGGGQRYIKLDLASAAINTQSNDPNASTYGMHRFLDRLNPFPEWRGTGNPDNGPNPTGDYTHYNIALKHAENMGLPTEGSSVIIPVSEDGGRAAGVMSYHNVTDFGVGHYGALQFEKVFQKLGVSDNMLSGYTEAKNSGLKGLEIAAAQTLAMGLVSLAPRAVATNRPLYLEASANGKVVQRLTSVQNDRGGINIARQDVVTGRIDVASTRTPHRHEMRDVTPQPPAALNGNGAIVRAPGAIQSAASQSNAASRPDLSIVQPTHSMSQWTQALTSQTNHPAVAAGNYGISSKNPNADITSIGNVSSVNAMMGGGGADGDRVVQQFQEASIALHESMIAYAANPLTPSVWNIGTWQQGLNHELEKAAAEGGAVVAILGDGNDFRDFNNESTPLVGDMTLERYADIHNLTRKQFLDDYSSFEFEGRTVAVTSVGVARAGGDEMRVYGSFAPTDGKGPLTEGQLVRLGNSLGGEFARRLHESIAAVNQRSPIPIPTMSLGVGILLPGQIVGNNGRVSEYNLISALDQIDTKAIEILKTGPLPEGETEGNPSFSKGGTVTVNPDGTIENTHWGYSYITNPDLQEGIQTYGMPNDRGMPEFRDRQGRVDSENSLAPQKYDEASGQQRDMAGRDIFRRLTETPIEPIPADFLYPELMLEPPSSLNLKDPTSLQLMTEDYNDASKTLNDLAGIESAFRDLFMQTGVPVYNEVEGLQKADAILQEAIRNGTEVHGNIAIARGLRGVNKGGRIEGDTIVHPDGDRETEILHTGHTVGDKLMLNMAEVAINTAKDMGLVEDMTLVRLRGGKFLILMEDVPKDTMDEYNTQMRIAYRDMPLEVEGPNGPAQVFMQPEGETQLREFMHDVATLRITPRVGTDTELHFDALVDAVVSVPSQELFARDVPTSITNLAEGIGDGDLVSMSAAQSLLEALRADNIMWRNLDIGFPQHPREVPPGERNEGYNPSRKW